MSVIWQMPKPPSLQVIFTTPGKNRAHHTKLMTRLMFKYYGFNTQKKEGSRHNLCIFAGIINLREDVHLRETINYLDFIKIKPGSH